MQCNSIFLTGHDRDVKRRRREKTTVQSDLGDGLCVEGARYACSTFLISRNSKSAAPRLLDKVRLICITLFSESWAPSKLALR